MKKNVKVQVNNLCKSFGDLKVIEDCSFQIKEGEFVCVVGPTGCGKTTFLNVLSNLLEPTSGEVLIDGEKASPRKHNLSFIFQEPSSLPWLTVEKNIAYGLKAKNKDKKYNSRADRKNTRSNGTSEVQKSIPRRAVYEFRTKDSNRKSLCSKSRFASDGRAIWTDGCKNQVYLEDEVIRMWKELQKTIIFITHNIEEAVYMAERVLILSNKPAKVKDEVVIDLPHPRRVDDPRFIEIRNYITEQIKWW